MSGNGPHPNKPKSVLCRRRALMRWTGWSREEIERLVLEGKLGTKRFHTNGRLYYYVESAQELLGS